jgi:putative endonuclease
MAQKEKNRYRQIIGAWGEDQAAEYLIEHGLSILQRNFRTSDGEIDLIASENDTLVFVEVKTRTNDHYGFPEEAVTEEKMDHLYTVVEEYLSEHLEVENWRIDVVAIQGKPGEDKPEIEWFQDAG